MSCILRTSGPSINTALSKIALKPYRMEGSTAHFDVSKAEFGDFAGQIKDAIAFLHSHKDDVKLIMDYANTTGVLDFAIESRDVAV